MNLLNHCILLIGRSRVAPLKFVLIPRLELTAATLSVRISMLKNSTFAWMMNYFGLIVRLFYSISILMFVGSRYSFQTESS